MFWNVRTLCTTCVTYACPKLYVWSFPVLVSVSEQLQPIVSGIGRQHGIGLTLFDNRLNEQWLFVQHSCQTGWMFVYTIQAVILVSNRLYHVNGVLGLFTCVCIALCTIVAHNTAQNRPDNFPSYPSPCSDDVYLREGGVLTPNQQCQCTKGITTGPQHQIHTV